MKHAFDFKGWREKLKLTQAEAAQALGITRQSFATSEKSGEATTERRLAMVALMLLKNEQGEPRV